MTDRTRKNLTTAMQCDALDAAKYQQFAARARMEGDWEIAKAFQETADADRTSHFVKESYLQHDIGSTPDNLRKAIDAEASEAEMFTRLASEAKEDGDLAAAATFEKIRKDKLARWAKFDAILGEIGVHSDLQTIKG